MTSKLFPPSRKREIPLGFKIAATEVKRVLDRIFDPILKENLQKSKGYFRLIYKNFSVL